MIKNKLGKDGLKSCSKCEVRKPLEAYHNLKKGRYGKSAYCKECAAKDLKKWSSKKRNHIKKRRKKYYHTTCKHSTQYVLRHRLGNAVSRYIVYKGYLHTEDFIGCTYEEVREHLEMQFTEGMTWDNYGEWQIDHIVPLSSGETLEELIALNHYTNLQPLWADENNRKGGTVQEGACLSLLAKPRANLEEFLERVEGWGPF